MNYIVTLPDGSVFDSPDLCGLENELFHRGLDGPYALAGREA